MAPEIADSSLSDAAALNISKTFICTRPPSAISSGKKFMRPVRREMSRVPLNYCADVPESPLGD